MPNQVKTFGVPFNSACSYHLSISIDTAVSAMLKIFSTVVNVVPKFRAHGGSLRENLAMQNVQVKQGFSFPILCLFFTHFTI